MTRIDPRKTEIQPIVELLESAEYDTPEALARAIVKQAYATFLKRDWWVTVIDAGGMYGPHAYGYGLHATPGAARQAMFTAGVERAMVMKINSAAGYMERWGEA